MIRVEDIECLGQEDQIWVRVFAKPGGQVVVSADEMMTRRHAELVAIADCGLKLFILPHQFQNAERNLQAAYICHHWPAIEARLANSDNIRFWKLKWGYPDEAAPWTFRMPGRNSKKPIAQIEKFREAARELETNDSEEALDRALKKVAKSKSPRPKEDRGDK